MDRTYDQRRQQGVSLFRDEMRSFSIGDRIQFTAPAQDNPGTLSHKRFPPTSRKDTGRSSRCAAGELSREIESAKRCPNCVETFWVSEGTRNQPCLNPLSTLKSC